MVFVTPKSVTAAAVSRNTRWYPVFFALCVTAVSSATAKQWQFEVFLDDKPVGQHRFTLRQDDAGKELHSLAEFDVKFLFINAYQYRHQSRERWQGDCLQSIDTETDDNGEQYRVQGRFQPEGFVVERRQGDQEPTSTTLPACVMTFAYWNPAMLKEKALLNVQDGQYMPVSIEDLGSHLAELGGDQVQVRRYRLTAEGVDIELWYDGEGDWQYLHSTTPDGYRIRYHRR